MVNVMPEAGKWNSIERCCDVTPPPKKHNSLVYQAKKHQGVHELNQSSKGLCCLLSGPCSQEWPIPILCQNKLAGTIGISNNEPVKGSNRDSSPDFSLSPSKLDFCGETKRLKPPPPWRSHHRMQCRWCLGPSLILAKLNSDADRILGKPVDWFWNVMLDGIRWN